MPVFPHHDFIMSMFKYVYRILIDIEMFVSSILLCSHQSPHTIDQPKSEQSPCGDTSAHRFDPTYLCKRPTQRCTAQSQKDRAPDMPTSANDRPENCFRKSPSS